MTSIRRTLPVLLVLLVLLCALPRAAAAATTRPELGPLNPAFVAALHDPMVTLGLGRLPSPVEVKVGAAAERRAASEELPSSFDLRQQGWLAPVEDQKQDSTCWAFGNIAALESAVASRQAPGTPAPVYSVDNLVRRSGYFSSPAQRYSMGGYDFMAVAYFARWAGPVLDSGDPYDHKPGANGAVEHVQGVDMVPGRTGPLDNALVKRLVMENGALSVGMWFAPESWLNESTWSYYDPRMEGENHGVDIVGWDDAYPAGDFGAGDKYPKGDGAFLVRNSWGPDWGDGGYFWVSYYDRSFAREQGLGLDGGMTSYSDVEDVGNYAQEYQYDKLGATATTGYRKTTVWGANRFVAAADQTIAAASFYTLSSSTRYQVFTGRTLRTLHLSASGTSELPGYITAPLTTTMPVSAGRSFVVAVKLTSPGELHPLAIEYPSKAIGSESATARKGQSYISANGKRWTDLTTLYRRSNVCLKAFAR